MKEKLKGLFSEKNDVLFHGTIYGHLPSGKNKYRIGRNRLFKNDYESKKYEQDFQIQALHLGLQNKWWTHGKPIEGFIGIFAKVFFRDMRRDVDTILFCDLLQKYGIIKNDRSIRIKIIDGVLVDKQNPRIEFFIFKIVQ